MLFKAITAPICAVPTLTCLIPGGFDTRGVTVLVPIFQRGKSRLREVGSAYHLSLLFCLFWMRSGCLCFLRARLMMPAKSVQGGGTPASSISDRVQASSGGSLPELEPWLSPSISPIVTPFHLLPARTQVGNLATHVWRALESCSWARRHDGPWAVRWAGERFEQSGASLRNGHAPSLDLSCP